MEKLRLASIEVAAAVFAVWPFFGPLVIPMLLPIDEIYFFVGGQNFDFALAKRRQQRPFMGLKIISRCYENFALETFFYRI